MSYLFIYISSLQVEKHLPSGLPRASNDRDKTRTHRAQLSISLSISLKVNGQD